MDDETFQIPGSVIEEVTSALNAAIGVTLVHAPSLHTQMMRAALALYDAVNFGDEIDLADDEND